MKNVCIVAEIGCNHNGDINLAKELLNIAKEAGVDYAKFQLFKTEMLVSPDAELAGYQKKNTDESSQFEMLKKLELSNEEYYELVKYADKLGVKAFATPFDLASVDYLESIGQEIWKIPSGEITNLPLLERIAEIKCPNKEIILSTGMATMDEIEDAVKVLENSKKTRFIILQCNTQYPTKDSDMNLLVMNELKENFPKWEVGLSDHSEGTVAAVAAVGMGAVFVEKHFTLDKNMPGPDHKASINPDELLKLCTSIRRAEIMLGDNHKKVTESEVANKNIARKSIVAACEIEEGDIFSTENLTCKRPGTGVSPMRWHEIMGTKAKRAFKENEPIEI